MTAPLSKNNTIRATAGELSQEKQKRQAARLPVASNGLLTVLKLIVVAFTGSASVFAEVINSAGDLLGSTVSYATVRVADEPPDETHTYGHGKYENLSGVFIGLLIVVGAAASFYEGLHRLIVGAPAPQTTWAIAVMTLSALINAGVSSRLLAVGKKLDSPALVADGKHLRTDILTSGTALAGLVATRVTHRPWIDPAAALLLSVFVFWIGVQIAFDAVRMLTDVALPEDEEQLLRETLDLEPRVLGYHKLRTRKAGAHRHIDVHIQIDDANSFIAAHDYSEELEEKLRATLPNLHPIIHIEPYEAEAKHQEEESAEDKSKSAL